MTTVRVSMDLPDPPPLDLRQKVAQRLRRLGYEVADQLGFRYLDDRLERSCDFAQGCEGDDPSLGILFFPRRFFGLIPGSRELGTGMLIGRLVFESGRDSSEGWNLAVYGREYLELLVGLARTLGEHFQVAEIHVVLKLEGCQWENFERSP